jgi:hypothetical protein
LCCKQSVLDYTKRIGDAQLSLWSQMTEVKEQLQRERDERRRELEAIHKTIHKGQADILNILKILDKDKPKSSGGEPDEHNHQHLTHLKEIWREGARASRCSCVLLILIIYNHYISLHIIIVHHYV